MNCRIPPNGGFTEYFPLNREENYRCKYTDSLKSSGYTYGEYPFRSVMQFVLFVEVGTRVEELLAHVLLFV